MSRFRSLLVLAAAVIALGSPASASALNSAQQDVAMPSFPVSSMTEIPTGFKIDGEQALHIATTQSHTLLAIHRHQHPLVYQVEVWIGSHYDITFFYHHKPVADVIVRRDGTLGRTWTGPQIEGIYGRGDYAPLFDTPWISVTFGALFLLPFLSLRRRGWGLAQLDLAVILGFGVSYALFNHAHLQTAVWLVYPPLLYLLARMLTIALRPASRGPALRIWLPTSVLLIGLIALEGGRIALALDVPRVLDVGVASVIGAYRALHGLPIYFPSLGHPDTYGAFTYMVYAPAELIWPWTGIWDYVSAARATAIWVDVATVAALYALGRQLASPGRQGHRLGLTLAWLWAACPFSLLGMMLSTNDGIVALLLVLALIALRSAAGRGVMLGLAVAAKFFPALLIGVIAVGPARDLSRKRVASTLIGCFIAAAGPVALLLPPGGIQEVWNHTIGYQISRVDVFSIWALHPGLRPIQDLFTLGALGLAVLLTLRPRGVRTPLQVSAAMAALVIAIELPAKHWFYFYIAWFLPLVLVALCAARGAGADPEVEAGSAAESGAAPHPELAPAGV
jgi:hypothetical protein